MKRILIIFSILTCLVCDEASAQTWNEWFRQKKTQRKYLVKQIGLLRLYLGYLKKGYEIADKGLTTISNIKDGDFNLHRDFFGSLKGVNPHIRNSAKVADIIAFQVFIVRSIGEVNDFCRDNEYFTTEEIRYVAAVYTNMLVLMDSSVAELLMVIRSGESEMKDDERLQRIDALHSDLLDKHAFIKSFDADVRSIAREREREHNAIESIRKQTDII
jgi:hypothetical protein